LTQIAGCNIHVEGLLPERNLTLTPVATADAGIYELQVELQADTPIRPTPISLIWEHKLVDAHYGAGPQRLWNLGGMGSRRLKSSAASMAPVICMLNYAGENRLTIAIADTINTTEITARHAEETGCITCTIQLFVDPVPPLTQYTTTIRFDTRAQKYWDALQAVSDWWAAMPQYTPAPVPEQARLPMYSSWYSFHLEISPEAIEKQCQLAKELGMDSVIVDDGWQTADNHRGYAYCGDWEPTTSKFPDFRAHVDRVHALGMKYLLWYSVPFVGIHTKAFERFKDKFLDPDPSGARKWFVLDPRFPDVREYLINIYENALRAYDLDGFKLDFVDCFTTREQTKDAFGAGRDFDSVPEAADRLLTDVIARLRAIKADVMIEFRQAYIGPAMRKYGNIFRVGDEPNNAAGNRLGAMLLRTLSGNTAIHSDMVMWHYQDTVESAAMQVLHAVFTVPQISVRLDEVPASHVAMIRRYLAFWREHRDVLLDGTIKPLQPQHAYPVVIAETDQKVAAAAYANGFIPLPAVANRTVLLINGTFEHRIVIELPESIETRTLTVWACTGECLRQEQVTWDAGVHAIPMPPAATAILQA
ncbi:MAG: glycoside hydrolase family 36 protein, partial [Kiritimatiellia bacterium]